MGYQISRTGESFMECVAGGVGREALKGSPSPFYSIKCVRIEPGIQAPSFIDGTGVECRNRTQPFLLIRRVKRPRLMHMPASRMSMPADCDDDCAVVMKHHDPSR